MWATQPMMLGLAMFVLSTGISAETITIRLLMAETATRFQKRNYNCGSTAKAGVR